MDVFWIKYMTVLVLVTVEIAAYLKGKWCIILMFAHLVALSQNALIEGFKVLWYGPSKHWREGKGKGLGWSAFPQAAFQCCVVFIRWGVGLVSEKHFRVSYRSCLSLRLFLKYLILKTNTVWYFCYLTVDYCEDSLLLQRRLPLPLQRCAPSELLFMSFQLPFSSKQSEWIGGIN